MATGGKNYSLGSSLNLGSDEDFEFKCTRCEGKNRIAEAKHYCPQCDEYYCNKCVEIHFEISALKSHALQGEEWKQNWGQGKTDCPVAPQCHHHGDQKVSMYCRQHDVLCCPVCAALDHKDCNGLEYIPNAACGIFNRPDLCNLSDEIESTLIQLELLVKNCKGEKHNLELSRQTCLDKLASFRKKIYTIIDDLEKKVIENMDNLCKESQNAVEDKRAACENTIQKLEQQQKILKDTDGITEAQMFINWKTVEAHFRECKSTVGSLTSSSMTDQFTFELDAELIHYFENIQSLGTFDIPGRAENCQKSKAQSQGHVYSVAGKGEVSVKLPFDKQDCCIESMCQLETGEIILADSINSSLKLMDKTYTVVDQIALTSYPYDVCSIDSNVIAVGLHNNTVQFVSFVNGKLTARKSIQLGHQCCSLTASKQNLYTSEYMGKKVYIYSSATCSQLRIIYKDKSKRRIFKQIVRLRVSADSSKLYVADSDMSIAVLNNQGQVLTRVHTDDLEDIGGMCVDLLGSIFVGCTSSSKVLQLVNNSAKVIANQKDGIQSPAALWFDTFHSKLLVFNGSRSPSILVLKLV